MQMDAPELSEDELNQLYLWIDQIPLSRPKRNITRDFSDGCMFAEIIAHFYPKIVELHNYPLAHSHKQKMINWSTLNSKVVKKLGFQLSKNDIEAIISSHPTAIERVLKVLQVKLEGLTGQNLTLSNNYSDQSLNIYPNQPINVQRNQPQMQQQQIRNPVQKQNQGNYINQQQQQYINPQDVKNLLVEKDQTIHSLRETVKVIKKQTKIKKVLELKIKKIEQLVKLKDDKIDALMKKANQSLKR